MEKVLDQRRTTYNWVNRGNDSELFIPFRKYKSLRWREALEKLLHCRLIIDRRSIDVCINENADYTNKKKSSVEVMPIDHCSRNILTRLAEFHDVRGHVFLFNLSIVCLFANSGKADLRPLRYSCKYLVSYDIGNQ